MSTQEAENGSRHARHFNSRRGTRTRMERLMQAVSDAKKVRENYLRTVEFRNPDWIPVSVGVLQAAWHKYREKLEDVFDRHKLALPYFRKGTICYDCFGVRRKGTMLVDEWGCIWHYEVDGLAGQVLKNPLKDWSNFDELKPPDPDIGMPVSEGDVMVKWDLVEENLRKLRQEGALVIGGLPHGFMFMRLHYLRGFINLMRDIATDEPKLQKLIDMVTQYNLELVRRILRIGVDAVSFGDDLGLQDRMPISEKQFRKYIFPSYAAIFGEVRKAGAHVHLHSDGHVMEVVDDIVESGVTALNIQDRVNGVENIARACKGKVTINLDIDRQWLLPFGGPEDIRRTVAGEMRTLASRKGGFMVQPEINVDVPLENVEAVLQTIEENMTIHKSLD